MSRLRGLLRSDAGAIAPAVPVLAFILLLLGGLVVDASRLLNARGRAVAYAEEAARAGASAIRPGQAVLALDEAVVEARVRAYCDAILGDPDQRGGVQECRYVPPLREVSSGDPRRLVVRVFVRLEIPAALLGMVGVQTLTATGEGSARPYEGLDPRDVDSSPPPVDVPVPENPPEAPPEVGVPVFPEPPPVPSVEPSPAASIPPVVPGDPSPAPSPDVEPGAGEP
jgi:hypothetical protein